MSEAAGEPMAAQCSELELVAAAQAGDRGAFDGLVARYRPGLLAAGFDLAGRFEVAEDLAQEALAHAWEHVSELREPRAFGPWLRTIAVNCYRMWLRRPWRHEAELAPARELSAEEDQFAHARRRELQRELPGALRALPRQSRLALLMRYHGECSYQQIADFLGVPVSTVAGRIYRAKRQLRPRLLRLMDAGELRR